MLCTFVLVVLLTAFLKSQGEPVDEKPIELLLVCYALLVCSGLWVIARLKRRASQVNPIPSSAPVKIAFRTIVLGLAGSAGSVAILLGAVSFIFNIPFHNLGKPYLMLTPCVFAGVSLIICAERIKDRPRLSAGLFGLGFSAGAGFAYALAYYSGLAHEMFPFLTPHRAIAVVTSGILVILFVAGYFARYKRLKAE